MRGAGGISGPIACPASPGHSVIRLTIRAMRLAALILAVLALALLIFGGWGRFSERGRASFDEMAGMIPLFAWWLGWVFAGGAGLVLILSLILGSGQAASGDAPTNPPVEH